MDTRCFHQPNVKILKCPIEMLGSSLVEPHDILTLFQGPVGPTEGRSSSSGGMEADSQVSRATKSPFAQATLKGEIEEQQAIRKDFALIHHQSYCRSARKNKVRRLLHTQNDVYWIPWECRSPMIGCGWWCSGGQPRSRTSRREIDCWGQDCGTHHVFLIKFRVVQYTSINNLNSNIWIQTFFQTQTYEIMGFQFWTELNRIEQYSTQINSAICKNWTSSNPFNSPVPFGSAKKWCAEELHEQLRRARRSMEDSLASGDEALQVVLFRRWFLRKKKGDFVDIFRYLYFLGQRCDDFQVFGLKSWSSEILEPGTNASNSSRFGASIQGERTHGKWKAAKGNWTKIGTGSRPKGGWTLKERNANGILRRWPPQTCGMLPVQYSFQSPRYTSDS